MTMKAKRPRLVFYDIKDEQTGRNFRAECARRGVPMAVVFRRVVEKVGAGDTALLDRICK